MIVPISQFMRPRKTETCFYTFLNAQYFSMLLHYMDKKDLTGNKQNAKDNTYHETRFKKSFSFAIHKHYYYCCNITPFLAEYMTDER